jgi:hypothetical protein
VRWGTRLRIRDLSRLFQNVAIASLRTSRLSMGKRTRKGRNLRLEICLGYKKRRQNLSLRSKTLGWRLRPNACCGRRFPGAHSATSFAAAQALQFYFGDKFTFDVASEVLAGVKRHFTSFSAAAKEAGLSRIYAGQYYRFDHNAGLLLGQNVSESIDETTLLPK